ncbi:hypothetical protein [Paragemmobacter ruber]|uniref:Uncharacterized protein n=1 Tax=Paragemmobacter ruber TaxID=1985673 RepID=A0ABW9Y358_9RHOB|nr:hypothetical protein [Rhodobacter ruber]NBE06939.1 hypothetical protein [Rhodobacter ruber]
MKNVIATSALLILVAGAASAAGNDSRQRADFNPAPVTPAQTVQVEAGAIYKSNKELNRAGVSADESVQVTVIPSSGLVDKRDGDN